MSGSTLGGKRAAATNKEKYGQDFYKRIGAEGGKKSKTGGFYANRELAREAGRLGGLKSKRGPSKKLTRSQMDYIIDRNKEPETKFIEIPVREA
jgi:hypothetical protein